MNDLINGPWSADANSAYFDIRDADGDTIADTCGSSCKLGFCGGHKTDPRTLAVTNLIAAAPELYDALVWAMKYVKQVRIENPMPTGCGEDIAYAEAVAALAKARGES